MSKYGGDSRCQSMSIFSNLISIPGGSNAFNFINFVAAVVTLMVNVNNNINNNNNNLNNVNVNTNNANNANANVNNNGVNSVVVMPGRWEIVQYFILPSSMLWMEGGGGMSILSIAPDLLMTRTVAPDLVWGLSPGSWCQQHRSGPGRNVNLILTLRLFRNIMTEWGLDHKSVRANCFVVYSKDKLFYCGVLN